MGTRHGQLNEAEEFEMVMKGCVARWVENLDDDTLKAIANSEVPADYAALNDLSAAGYRRTPPCEFLTNFVEVLSL